MNDIATGCTQWDLQITRKSKHFVSSYLTNTKESSTSLAHCNAIKSQEQSELALADIGTFSYLLVALYHMWNKHLEINCNFYFEMGSHNHHQKEKKISNSALGYISWHNPKRGNKTRGMWLEYWVYSGHYIQGRLM